MDVGDLISRGGAVAGGDRTRQMEGRRRGHCVVVVAEATVRASESTRLDLIGVPCVEAIDALTCTKG